MEKKTEKMPLTTGLVMSPNKINLKSLSYNVNTHKRAGSTGTTGDESYTTEEEEDNNETDEVDFTIKEHLTNKLYDNSDFFGSYSNISTISDQVTVLHRNGSFIAGCDFERISNTSDGSDKKSSDSSDIPKNSSSNSLACSDGDRAQFSNVTPPLSSQSSSAKFGDSNASDCDEPFAKTVLKRNSSDSSEYSDLGDDLNDVLHEETKENLREQLNFVKKELEMKNEEIERLGRIKLDVQTELEDLTASLFEVIKKLIF